jgi:lysozyme
MDLDKLEAEIIQDEGERYKAYRDSEGIWTDGIGHNLEAHGYSPTQIEQFRTNGVTQAQVDQWFKQDIASAVECCQRIFPTFGQLNDARQRVLVNMAFDLMYELKDWHHLQAAIASQDWQAAKLSILGSKFATQGPLRCSRLAVRMFNG